MIFVGFFAVSLKAATLRIVYCDLAEVRRFGAGGNGRKPSRQTEVGDAPTRCSHEDKKVDG
jgi:hypothetical protein